MMTHTTLSHVHTCTNTFTGRHIVSSHAYSVIDDLQVMFCLAKPCHAYQLGPGELSVLQARLPEIEQLSKELNARTEELSDLRFKLEEDKATASAAQVTLQNSCKTDKLHLLIACLHDCLILDCPRRCCMDRSKVEVLLDSLEKSGTMFCCLAPRV